MRRSLVSLSGVHLADAPLLVIVLLRYRDTGVVVEVVEKWKNGVSVDGDGKCLSGNIEIYGSLEGSVFRYETGVTGAFKSAVISLLTVHESPALSLSLLRTLEMYVH
jgi:hypothetical protein